MPQASQEVQEKIDALFGHHDPQDLAAQKYLESRGWIEEPPGWWTVTPDHYPTDDEWLCMLYLIEEWDHALRG